VRVLFAGTPDAAVPSLERILVSGHELIGVLTRPDAPAGRGRRLTRSPVAEVADAAGVEVLTPRRPSDPAFLTRLAELGPDGAAIVAYGGLIPPKALGIPAHGWVNLHFSLLPAWRGAAPVQHAVIAGNDLTGASTFALEAGLDTGPVYGTLTEPIRATDTAGDLLGRLAVVGADLLLATLDAIADGTARPVAQPADGVSLAPKLQVEDARVDWTQPELAVDRLVRGVTPEPGAWTTLDGERLGIGPLDRVPDEEGPASPDRPLRPGELRIGRRAVLVGTATRPVRLGMVAPAGRRPMPAADWARGLRPPPVPHIRLGT